MQSYAVHSFEKSRWEIGVIMWYSSLSIEMMYCTRDWIFSNAINLLSIGDNSQAQVGCRVGEAFLL